MKLPKKPTLNSLKGYTVISPQLREALGINEGILTGEVKNWNNLSFLVSSYFEYVDNYDLQGEELHDAILSTLDDLSKLKLIGENEKKQKKSGADHLVLINNSAIMVPQAKLLMNYCRNMKAYLSSPATRNSFLFHYAKVRELKRREGERIRRQEEEEEEKARMLHNGKMIAYLAAEKGSSEIQDDLQAQTSQETGRKRHKDKERAVEEEEGTRRTKTRTVSPAPVEQDDNDISFVTTASGGTYEDRNDSVSSRNSPVLAYITSFDELIPITEENLFDLAYMSSNLPITERLNMSGIAFANSISDGCFLPEALDDDVTNMINKFTRAIEYHTKSMLLSPTKIEHINIVSLLNTSFFNNCKESDVCQYNYQYYQAPEQLKNMENDFKIKYVVPFVNAAFDVNDKLVVYWDTPLNLYKNSNMKIQRRQTTDAKFATIDGIEIGVVEIKPFKTPFEMLEEDRVRLAEISKKMLHKRILAAKSEKELNTFAIMIAGHDIEYFVHEYNPQESAASGDKINNAKKYTFRLLKKSILPTFPTTFSCMSLSLESIIHYKKMMVKSIASASDAEKPYLYSDDYKRFDPTVTLLKLNE
ncbi:hypothetical protein A0J61_10599 [Choanephora cucurbitarum]|uniref:Uncharacterized protein n=1 Tax=Choanephora cucurbitarum TaxID=101091 RepID=A0A1C7MX08_9FUNG|nr:hypothetical protein A0J61_10599 [Choanephora cucurbitarum]